MKEWTAYFLGGQADLTKRIIKSRTEWTSFDDTYETCSGTMYVQHKYRLIYEDETKLIYEYKETIS